MSQEATRILSSPATFVLKFVLPVAFGGLLSVVAIVMFLTPSGWRSTIDVRDRLWFLGGTLIGTVFIVWYVGSLKRVRMDERALYISNYFTEIVVPLTEVTEIRRSLYGSLNPTTIEFGSPTAFGSSIEFLPAFRWGSLLGSPPVTEEIREAVAKAKGIDAGESRL